MTKLLDPSHSERTVALAAQQNPARVPSAREGSALDGASTTADAPWTPEHSARLYQVAGWGKPYFSVNEEGKVLVRPDPDRDIAIDLHALTVKLEERGFKVPMLFRFADIVRDRIRRLNKAFQGAIKAYGYKGNYQGVFPVKVNQQNHLIQDIVRFGEPFDYGLEAGSKPELLIALAAMEHRSGGLIVCNGYKDRGYIETALLAQRLDRRVIIVIERLEEVDLAIRAARAIGVRPMFGVRAKLTSKGTGRWGKSSGEHAKFGLSYAEIIDLVDRLKQADMLDRLMMLHFHIGSQISSIVPIKGALQEASSIFVELAKLGCDMRYLDVGGGLAIDYDGSKTDRHTSKNYRTSEYAADVVFAVQTACDKAGIDHPTLVSESGRSIASHHAVLVFDVVGNNRLNHGPPQQPGPEAPRVLRDLWYTLRNTRPNNVQESYHDARQCIDDSKSLFKLGYLSLRDQAAAERLFWHCCRRIQEEMAGMKRIPEELLNLERMLATIYYCNFSIFQSAPDSWAIDQVFPIMPIHRLTEKPTEYCTLADLTCDSDGMVDSFIDDEEEREVLPAHTLRDGETYYLGMFLNGAYQEILGDLHNLFGDTNAAHIHLSDDGYEIVHIVKGDSVGDVLRYVQYDPKTMVERIRRQAERAAEEGQLTNEQLRMLISHYEESLRGYTYLTD